MVNEIKCSLTKVDKILHVADIHIRNWKRHKEYGLVFEKLYQAIDLLPPDSIVTVGGDIVHAKTDMSPELIHMVSSFFGELASRRPTIVIAGNHDTNLNNNHRLDALTPIVEANKHPNLFYLRDSGVYRIGNLAISVMSLLGDRSDHIRAEDMVLGPECEDLKKVAMFHGTVVNSHVDSGMVISHGLDWQLFAGFDLVLLGDIHKRQVLSPSNPLMFFPGSLIQQSFGESFEGHGYSVVDVESMTASYVDIPNEYGFYTIHMDGGMLPSKLPITPKTSVRIKATNTDPAQMKRALATLRKEYGVSEVVVNNLDRSSADSNLDGLSDSLYQADVRNPQVQRQLITEYLKDEPIDTELFEQVLAISDNLNQQLTTSETARGVVWKPKKFEFSNMFSYGEGNVVDFEKLEGTCGIFAPNHAGKSAVLDALCFCLFGYTSRSTKTEMVLNNRSDWFSCKLNFELNGHDYFIEKKATRYAKGPLAGRLRVDIDFWFINDEGAKVSLNGEQRRDTDKVIQSYIGSFSDFILTSLQLQGNNSNFVEKTQGERKELLANFLDLAIFDQLSDLANKEFKTATILLENYQKQDFETILGDAEKAEPLLQARYDSVTADIVALEESLDKSNKQLNTLNKQLQPCKADGLDLNQLVKRASTLEEELSRVTKLVPEMALALDKAVQDYEVDKAKLAQLRQSFDKELYEAYISSVQQEAELARKATSLELVVASKLDKLAKLATYEYDPNCTFCVNNIFVKDALSTKEQLKDDQALLLSTAEQWQSLKDFIEVNSGIVDTAAELTKLEQDVARKEILTSQARYRSEGSVKDQSLAQHGLDKVKSDIQTYNDNLQIIESNKRVNDQIEALNQQLSKTRVEIGRLRAKSNQIHYEISSNSAVLEGARKTINHMQELVTKLAAYDVYCRAVHRDGIPFVLISRAVPFIQDYVNNILSQVVDFMVTLETDGKNINAFIGYDGTRWPLELASGMERFVSSLAIRIALIKTTNLPKPDFIAIDEGLGVLDSTNLNSMHLFFAYMKDVFRFSLIISHIDVVRDMVDHIISIDRKEPFSYIKG